MASVDVDQVLENLRVLADLTSDPRGAQRIAWSETWREARRWMSAQVEGMPIEVDTDAAGNRWFTLRGRSPEAVLIGGHIDSVPNGGWLDGSLNLLAGLATLRSIAAESGPPPLTIRLVDWADEEGRFGWGLLGSSAASGTLDVDRLASANDPHGGSPDELLAENGVSLSRMLDAGRQLEQARAYLELHIEQGPVLERLGLPLGVVTGTYGVQRHKLTFIGRAMHAGSTPMNERQDALLAAAKTIIATQSDAVELGGRATTGRLSVSPDIYTIVPGRCTMTLDQRHTDEATLMQMLYRARQAAADSGAQGDSTVEWERLWEIEPLKFDDELIELAEEAVISVAGRTQRLASGPLHDAAEMVRAGLPTAMIFVRSIGGISHNAAEDSAETDIRLAVAALDRLVRNTIELKARTASGIQPPVGPR